MRKRLLATALAIMMIFVVPVSAMAGTDSTESVEQNDTVKNERGAPTIAPANSGSTAYTGWTAHLYNPKTGESTTYVYKITSSTEVTLTKYKTSGTKIKIPATVNDGSQEFKVTAIGPKALKGNKSLKSVTIGKNVKTIGNKAFAQCPKLTKITIPSKVKTIGMRAFYNCKSLKTITIKSKKLKSVGKEAITRINKKATIYVPQGKKKAYKKLFTKQTGFKKTMKIKKS